MDQIGFDFGELLGISFTFEEMLADLPDFHHPDEPAPFEPLNPHIIRFAGHRKRPCCLPANDGHAGRVEEYP